MGPAALVEVDIPFNPAARSTDCVPACPPMYSVHHWLVALAAASPSHCHDLSLAAANKGAMKYNCSTRRSLPRLHLSTAICLPTAIPLVRGLGSKQRFARIGSVTMYICTSPVVRIDRLPSMFERTQATNIETRHFDTLPTRVSFSSLRGKVRHEKAVIPNSYRRT